MSKTLDTAPAPAATTDASASAGTGTSVVATETETQTASQEGDDALPEVGADTGEESDELPEIGADDTGEETEQASDDAADSDQEGDEQDDEAPTYDFEPPEGSPPYRAEVLDAYKAKLTEHKVDPKVGKDLLDSMLPVIARDFEAQITEQQEKTVEAWRADLEQRHGQRLAEQRRLVNRALSKGTPELTNFLRQHALALPPDLHDLLAFFGQRITNDRPPRSSAHPQQRQRTALEEAAAEYDAEAAQRG